MPEALRPEACGGPVVDPGRHQDLTEATKATEVPE